MQQDVLKPVALISMPTLSARFPSFQLGLLKPVLERAGIPCQTFSLYMYFGQRIGYQLNETLAEVWPSLVGEWVWSKAAFGQFADDNAYFEAYRENFADICRAAGCTLDDIRNVRDVHAPEFLDAMLDATDWSRFGVIGFTVVFQQMLASMAFARRLKEKYPHIPIVFGGATFEDDIALEVMKGCPYVDLVHCGDAEDTFPELVRRLHNNSSLAGLKGLMRREHGEIVDEGRAPNLEDMDRTPTPDFDEYFYARRESGYGAWPGAKDVMIPMETARGCWWGMKNHCTFCGLNRAGMDFRAKSPDNVLRMMRDLSLRYGVTYLNAIDNILAPEYVEQLFGRLAATRSDIRVHYEIRPSVKHETLRKMWEGGLFSVQPGVESLNTRLLKIMKKHTTGMRNVELIKWCTYYGIINLYNLLVRFGGETVEDYTQQVGVIEQIGHYQPPYAIARARPDRGSPMYTQPELHGISGLRAEPCYRFIYPHKTFNLRRISYYFEPDTTNTLPDAAYRPIFDAVGAWQRGWESSERPYLRYTRLLDTLVVVDGRRSGPPVQTVLEGDDVLVHEACADARDEAHVVGQLGDAARARAALQRLERQGLLLALDDRYLALALPVNAGH